MTTTDLWQKQMCEKHLVLGFSVFHVLRRSTLSLKHLIIFAASLCLSSISRCSSSLRFLSCSSSSSLFSRRCSSRTSFTSSCRRRSSYSTEIPFLNKYMDGFNGSRNFSESTFSCLLLWISSISLCSSSSSSFRFFSTFHSSSCFATSILSSSVL